MSVVAATKVRLPDRFWSAVDWFINVERAELGADQLVRFRTVICATMVLSASHLGIAFAFSFDARNHNLALANVVLAFLLGLGPWISKFSRSLFVASMYVSVLLLGTIVFVALHEDGYYWIASAWLAIVPVLAMFLVGARGGLLVSALALLVSGLVVVCHNMGLVLPGHLVPPEGSIPWILNNFGAIGFLITSTYFHTLSRERSVNDLADSQGKLMAVVNCSSDFIFAIDANYRLTIFNPPFYSMIRNNFALEPRLDASIKEFIPEQYLQTWRTRSREVRNGRDVRFEEKYQGVLGDFYLEISLSPILSNGEFIGLTCIGRDVTARKHSEKLLEQSNSRLISLSREAGMSDVATGILHNVGNVLNSVNISTCVIAEKLGEFKSDRLASTAALLQAYMDTTDISSIDKKIQLIPRFLVGLGEHQAQLGAVMHDEVTQLAANIDHIKHIIAMQQSLVKSSVVVERIALQEVVDAAIDVSTLARGSLAIDVQRDYEELEAFLINRHKVLQILVNLLGNARHAVRDSNKNEKTVRVRIRQPTQDTACVEVIDNGVGIAQENRDRLFMLGYTTKTDGNGYGLHTCALVAQEIGATITFTSDGPDQGAVFCLLLPIRGKNDDHE